MANKRLDEDEKRVNFSLSIKKKYLDELRKMGKVSVIIELLVEKYLKIRKNNEK